MTSFLGSNVEIIEKLGEKGMKHTRKFELTVGGNRTEYLIIS